MLRRFVLKKATQISFQDIRNIYFAQIDEIIEGKIAEAECLKRKSVYEKFSAFNFPPSLASKAVAKVAQTQGVSAGEAVGKLINVDQITQLKGDILYTKILAPELTQYFGKIAGIVSEQGGLLSHLAIMARENHLPVVVGFSLQKSGILLGDIVKIDGSTGAVVKNNL